MNRNVSNCEYSSGQAPVVPRVDNTIQWVSVNKTNYTIHWIVIYPLDNVMYPLNNRALVLFRTGTD